MGEYPEHIKLTAINDKSQACYDFIEWLGEVKGIALGHHVTWDGWDHEDFTPYNGSLRDLLAEHFEIDMGKIEAEKRAMVDALREGT